MCTQSQGREIQHIFAKYYSGREVEPHDYPALEFLTVTGYLEMYLEREGVYARAGSIGRLFDKPDISEYPAPTANMSFDRLE